MSYLSIRHIPIELEREIKKEAKKRNITKTTVVIEALKSFFRIGPTQVKLYRDVRNFFGKMSPDDYKEFKSITKDFSKIDEDMWK